MTFGPICDFLFLFILSGYDVLALKLQCNGYSWKGGLDHSPHFVDTLDGLDLLLLQTNICGKMLDSWVKCQVISPSTFSLSKMAFRTHSRARQMPISQGAIPSLLHLRIHNKEPRREASQRRKPDESVRKA